MREINKFILKKKKKKDPVGETESEIQIAVQDTLGKLLSIVSDESTGSKDGFVRSKSILLSGTYSLKDLLKVIFLPCAYKSSVPFSKRRLNQNCSSVKW